MIVSSLTLCVLAGHVLSHPAVVSGGGHGGEHDDKYYTDFSEVRSGDEAGNIKGEYHVRLPDGRVQHVVYLADGNYGGTVMEVSYDGKATHPEYHGHGGHGGHE